MELTDKMLDRIKELADELFFDYEVVGIRTQDHSFNLGEMDHVSHVWVDGDDTGEELGGVCAVKSDYAGHGHNYFGSHVAVVAGNHYTYGEDPGEIIISDPVVVEIFA